MIPTWEELENEGLGMENEHVRQIREWVLRNQDTPLMEAFAQITEAQFLVKILFWSINIFHYRSGSTPSRGIMGLTHPELHLMLPEGHIVNLNPYNIEGWGGTMTF